MKTFCEVCTTNPATLVCCADDAVMCGSCDQRCVFAAFGGRENGEDKG